jgi:diguanylate cyclase (GGDEF)-like protein
VARVDRWYWLGVAGLLYYVSAAAVTTVVTLREPQLLAVRVAGPMILPLTLSAAVLAGRAAADRRLHHVSRRAWRWITCGVVLQMLSNALLAATGENHFPGPGDLVRMIAIPVIIFGLLRLPVRTGHAQRAKVALDAGISVAAAGGFLWYLQVGPTIELPGVTAGRVLVSLLLPLTDLFMVFGIATVLLRGADPAVRTSVRLLAVGAVPWLIGDVTLGYHMAHPGAQGITGWQMLCFLTCQFMLAAAGYQQFRSAGRSAGANEHVVTRQVTRLPYAAVVVAYGLLLYVAIKQGAMFPWGGLVLCAFVLTALVGVRQVIAQQENHRMAITDSLTGLANRARLHEALGIALGRAGRQGQSTAVLLCDLDGFKQVNDTMGHKAGDQLLVAYAAMLRRSIMGADIAARIGGDEFALVLHDIGTAANAEAVARRIMHETATPVMIGDTPVQVRGSIGIAVTGPGEMTGDELMHRADLAMYEAKRRHEVTWHHYTADA